MKVLGVQTTDFAVYYDLVHALRTRGIPFVVLAPGEPVPAHVGALLTTSSEAARLDHPGLVAFTEPQRSIDEALRVLDGSGSFRRCIIGIDPGERPGVAVLADGRVRRLQQAPHPEAVRGIVDEVLASLPAQRFILRVGNGAPTFRDRILHTLVGLDVHLELVDESHSTPLGAHANGERDTQAATSIALTPGRLLLASEVRPVVPTEGELRDIQRKSRLASDGALTISRALARNVAIGRLTLDEAIHRMRGKASP